MSTVPASMQEASIHAHCKTFGIPTIAAQYSRIAEQATRQGHSRIRYLEALLAAEVEERQQRRIAWRLSEARLPKIKPWKNSISTPPASPTTQIRGLADGGYLERAEPVIFLGETGTGKTHLMTALCVEACRQNRRVRFTTVAALINELVEASNNSQLSRSLSRWKKWDLIALDEMGYVPLAEAGAELLFQVIADRADRLPSSSQPICRSENGRRSSPTPAFARHCWTASPTALASSRPEPVVPLPSHHGTEENLTKVGQISPSFYFSSATLRRSKTNNINSFQGGATIHRQSGAKFKKKGGGRLDMKNTRVRLCSLKG